MTVYKKYLSLLFLLMGSLVYSANDYIKPTILHQIVEDVFEGQALIIEAVVMDNVDVRDVLVYYRVKGKKVFIYKISCNDRRNDTQNNKKESCYKAVK